MAKLVEVGSIRCYFESLSDPRHTRNRKHLLVDVIVIAVAAIGADATVPLPCIAGPSASSIGWPNIFHSLTASPRATVFAAS